MKYVTGAAKKAFSWSYSKIKNYRTCPRRYYEIDVLKKYVEPENETLKWGNQVHKAFEQRIGKGVAFPKGMENFEDAAVRLLAVPGIIKVEQQLAITDKLLATTWFGKDAWFRAIADYLAVNGPVALAIDYKTGKIIEDSEQLALLAECIFAHYPEVQAVRTEFWWLKDDCATKEVFYRKDRARTWRKILPEVMTLKKAHETMAFPEKQSGLCRKYCAVVSCPYNGANQ